MSTRSGTVDGCFNSMQGGCILGFWNVFFLAFIALMTYFFWSSFTLATQGVSTTGRVIALEESQDEDGVTYSPIFEFTVNGQRYEAESGISSDPPAHRVGDDIRIRYNPANPSHADEDTFLNSPWIYGGILAVFVVALVGFNVYGMRRIWRGESLDDE